MRNEYTLTKHTLHGRPCVKHTVDKTLTIVGRKGHIWAYSDTELACFIQSGSGKLYKEQLHRFKPSELSVYCGKIQAPTSAYLQLEIANQDRLGQNNDQEIRLVKNSD